MVFKDLNSFVFHFDIFGRERKEKQLLKMLSIFIIFFVFQFEISGKDSNILQSEKIPSRVNTFSIFHFEISGKFIKEEQL